MTMSKQQISLFLFCRFISSLGDQFLLFAVPLIVYQFTHNIAMSGLAFFLEWLPRIISLPVAGALSDKYGGRRIYLVADFFRALFCIISFLIILFYPASTFWIIALMMGACAFFYAQSFIALEATIPAMIELSDMHKAQSLVQAIEQSTFILGPLFASLLIIFFPARDIIFMAAVVFLMSYLGILQLSEKLFPKIKRLAKKHIGNDMLDGLKIFLSNKSLICLTILTIAINLIWGLTLSTNAAMVTGYFKSNATVFGLMQSITGVVGICLALLVPIFVRRYSVYALGLLVGSLIIVGGFLAGFSAYLFLYIIGYVLVNGLDGVFNVFIRTERVKYIPKADMGKTIGIIVLLNQLSLPVAGLLVAHFSSGMGIHLLFIVISTITLVVFVTSMVFFKIRKTTPERILESNG